ncbi:MAG: hypothetical protein II237_01740 [Clostridia bacterium]|nr:hypothetical protein [Clostridia bacterium]
MTDNEIIKVLEYCTTDGWCTNCPHEKKCIEDEITQLALDLINRQQAEIERLKRVVSHLEDYANGVADQVKAEAVKEFAELLKEHIRDYHPYYYVIDEEVVDNLVEEMVGENNAPCN